MAETVGTRSRPSPESRNPFSEPRSADYRPVPDRQQLQGRRLCSHSDSTSPLLAHPSRLEGRHTTGRKDHEKLPRYRARISSPKSTFLEFSEISSCSDHCPKKADGFADLTLQEVPVLKPGATGVLVKIHAVSLNVRSRLGIGSSVSSLYGDTRSF